VRDGSQGAKTIDLRGRDVAIADGEHDGSHGARAVAAGGGQPGRDASSETSLGKRWRIFPAYLPVG